MASSNKNSHLTLSERFIIETACFNGSTKAAVAITLGKDKSTIGKEIKAHRILKHKCNLPLECSAYKNALMAETVLLPVLITFLSNVIIETVLLVYVTVVLPIFTAGLISSFTLLILLINSTCNLS